MLTVKELIEQLKALPEEWQSAMVEASYETYATTRIMGIEKTYQDADGNKVVILRGNE